MYLHENPKSLLTMQRGHTQMKTSDLCLNNKKKLQKVFKLTLVKSPKCKNGWLYNRTTRKIHFIHWEGIFRFQPAKFQEIGIKFNWAHYKIFFFVLSCFVLFFWNRDTREDTTVNGSGLLLLIFCLLVIGHSQTTVFCLNCFPAEILLN